MDELEYNQEMFERIAKHDEGAIRELFLAHRQDITDQIRAKFSLIMKSNSGIEDEIYDDAVLALVRDVKRRFAIGEKLRNSLKSLLWTIVRRIAIRVVGELRRIGDSVVQIDILAGTQHEPSIGLAYSKDLSSIKYLRIALKGLGDECQRILNNFYSRKIPAKVDAEAMEIARETYQRKKKECLLKMRKALGTWGIKSMEDC